MSELNIERINELATIAKQRGLTEEEKAERTMLRAAYIDSMKAGLRATLENTFVQYPDGEKRPLSKMEDKK